jgi:hypothetical protein
VAAAATLVPGTWEGVTAEAFDGHRVTITGDLSTFGSTTETAAGVLDEIAGLLEAAQTSLDTEAARVAGIPTGVDANGGFQFEPLDEAQETTAHEVIAAVSEIRSGLDEDLASRESALIMVQAALAIIAEAWRPRTLRHVNLNIGQGHGQGADDTRGTDHSNISDIAKVLVRQNADVATLQEVFERDIDDLRNELRQRTGDEWRVVFAPADNKPYVSSDITGGSSPYAPRIPNVLPDAVTDWVPSLDGGDGVTNTVRVNEPFGNAVLVRVTDGVDVNRLDPYRLDHEGPLVPVEPSESVSNPPPADIHGPNGDEFYRDGEARVVAGAEVTFPDDR